MRIFLLVLCMAPFVLRAQADSLYRFTGVVTVDTASKTQLFERARLWFTDYYKSAKAVLQVSDKESGELIGKPIIATTYNYRYFGADHKQPLNANATIRILVKDGKYKYEIYDLFDPVFFKAFTVSDECPQKVQMQKQSKTNVMWQSAKSNIAKEVEEIIASLNKYMNNKGSISKDDF